MSRELTERGLDETAVVRAPAAGDLDRLRINWYAERLHHPDVATAVRAGGVLACVSALRLHGLWVAPGYAQVHIRRSKALRGRIIGCRPYRGRPLPTTTAVDPVVYALACAARCMTAEDWVAACDSYLAVNDVDRLRADIAPYGGATVDALLEKVDGRSQSGTESIARVRLRALGFHVVTQPAVDYGIYRGHADLRIGKLLIECDGERFHSRPRDRANDHIRDRKSSVDGWATMRVAYRQVMHAREWDEFVEDVRAFTRAGRHRVRDRRSRDAFERSGDGMARRSSP
ncbi:hypothetical protein [Gordonia shandongensis]|uniref:hypothetical protein n=1 Tax=Gordonia shandongensis TaxID=376351 RepID=UPI000427B758|nr:hypothetical protein [Gordonia shandongensis]